MTKANRIPESVIQKQILTWLQYERYYAWRNFVGPILRGGKLSPNPSAGQPDIFGILKNYPGRLFAIEVKAENGVLSPKQRIVLDDMRRVGVIVIVAYDLETVQKNLRLVDVA